MAGGPSQIETVRSQAAAPDEERRTAARFGPPGPAAHRHVGQPVVAAARRSAVRVRAARPQRHLGVRPAAPHRRHRRRSVPRPLDVHRGHQPRPGHHLLPERVADCRPPQHRRVGALRARQRQRQPAGVRRPDHAGQGRSAALRAAVGQRLPAVAASGRAVPQRQGAGALPGESGRRRRRRAGARCSIGCAICSSTRRRGPATPKWTAASPSTRWPIACRRACRA